MAATAQTPAAAAPAGPEKVAVITFQQAVTQTNEFQRNFADLQTKFNPKREQLKSLNDEIDALKKQLQAQGATLNDTERASRARNIDDKQKQLQRDAEDDQNDFKQAMQDTFNGVASKVGDVLISYAQRHGYSLVIDGGQEQSPGGSLREPLHRHHQGSHRGLQPEVGRARSASAACGLRTQTRPQGACESLSAKRGFDAPPPHSYNST